MLDLDQIRERIGARMAELELPPTGKWFKDHGLSQSTVRHFVERRTRSMTLDTLSKLVEPLKTTEEWLLFGDKPPVEISAETMQEMVHLALQEIQPGMTLAEIRPAVASALHAQLVHRLAGGEVRSIRDAKIAPGKAARSAPATKPDAPGLSRSA